ncbi:uncharacterized protein LOC144745809 [Ciona intestinalis]
MSTPSPLYTESSTLQVPGNNTEFFKLRPRGAQWILYAIIVLLFAVAVYLFVVIVYYVVIRQLKVGEKNEAKTQKSYVDRTASKSGSIYKILMLVLCFFMAALCVVFFTVQQFIIFARTRPATLILVIKFAFGTKIVLGYAFMWLRQRLFYTGPLRRLHRKNSPLLILSTVSLAFILVNIVAQIVLTWYWSAISARLPEMISWLVGCTLVQSTLLCLFVYPLWKQNSEKRRSLRKESGNEALSNLTNGIDKLIRRSLIIACIWFTSDLLDILVQFISEAINGYNTVFLHNLVLNDLNAIVNTVCLVASFNNWKCIMFPWWTSTKPTEEDTVKETVTSQIPVTHV